MGFLKNKRAVEALPLRYIIIALVAALVIGIALQFVGILKSGTISAATKMNESLSERTACELDMDGPVITFSSHTCSNGDLTVNVNIKDDCGVDENEIGMYTNVTSDTNYDLTLNSGTTNDGSWKFTGNDASWDVNKMISVTVWAKDKSTTATMGTKSDAINCTT
jgi:hypothetical protein